METSRRVLRAYRLCRCDPELKDAGLLDVVPAYCSLALHFEPVEADRRGLERRSRELLEAAAEVKTDDSDSEPGRGAHRLSVIYDGPDLDRVASRAGLSLREIVRLHAAPEYTVAMIGFLPHFPYLIGMDPRLATPRLSSPRKNVPAGTVAIGGAQTGIYPEASPGGWNLIGSTDPKPLERIMPGDRVVFEARERPP